jgi:hypothetical protein
MLKLGTTVQLYGRRCVVIWSFENGSIIALTKNRFYNASVDSSIRFLKNSSVAHMVSDEDWQKIADNKMKFDHDCPVIVATPHTYKVIRTPREWVEV